MEKTLKTLIRWTRNEVRLRRDPSVTPYPFANLTVLTRRYNTHSKFIKKEDTLSDAEKPVTLTREVKWKDWIPSFLNYLRTIPGRDGHLLKYVCRDSDASDPTPNVHFLNDYVAMTLLIGKAYTIDSAEVFTLIIKFIAGNETAKAKIQPHVNLLMEG